MDKRQLVWVVTLQDPEYPLDYEILGIGHQAHSTPRSRRELDIR